MLQAETENEMREWMSSFEKAKRLMLQTEQLDFKIGTAMSTVSVVDTESSPKLLDNISKSKPTTMVDELPAISINNSISDTNNVEQKKPSIVMLSTSHKNDLQSFTEPTSLTPLLVWEASRASMGASNNTTTASAPTSPATQSFSAAAISLDATLNNYNEKDDTSTLNGSTTNTIATTNSSWGIPWALVPSMFQGSTDDISSELTPTPGGSPNAPAVTDADGHQVIWPTRVDDSNVPRVDLTGYSPWLDTRNRELRHLFGGVGSNEVVLSGMIYSIQNAFLLTPF